MHFKEIGQGSSQLLFTSPAYAVAQPLLSMHITLPKGDPKTGRPVISPIFTAKIWRVYLPSRELNYRTPANHPKAWAPLTGPDSKATRCRIIFKTLKISCEP